MEAIISILQMWELRLRRGKSRHNNIVEKAKKKKKRKALNHQTPMKYQARIFGSQTPHDYSKQQASQHERYL